MLVLGSRRTHTWKGIFNVTGYKYLRPKQQQLFPSHYKVKIKKIILLAFSDLQYSLYLKSADTHTCHSDLSSEHEMFTNKDKFWATGYTVNVSKNTMTELFWGQLFNNVFRDYTIALSAHDIYFYDFVSCRHKSTLILRISEFQIWCSTWHFCILI